MALDFIAWAPEIQFLVVMLGLLYYGTGPAVAPVTEALWIPSGWTQSKSQGPKLDKPSAGPDYIPSHLTSWAIVTCLLTAWLIWDSPLPVLQAGGAFIRDPFTQMMGGFLMVFASACLAAANGWLRKAHVIHPEYIVLILLAILGQHLLIMTSDLMALYLCLELQSFALVVLCSLNYTSPYAIEAGMKYFLLSAFSSCLLLLGIGLIYWETGLTRCSHIQELLSADLEPNLTLWLGLWLVGVGLLWKLAAAPLHMWAADVYQGAWTSVTLLISTLPKISVLAFWVHSWHALWTTAFGEAMAIFSALSLIVGALAPMAQSQLKRLLAFSSISHMGFLLIPLVQGTEGLSALWAYLILYLLTNLALWGLMLWPFARGKFTTSGPQSIWDLAGLNAYMPVAATAWAGGMLSLAGLPPVAGFLGKLGIFWWGLNQHQYALMTLALVATLLSTVYYLRVLKVAYVDQPKAWGQFESMAPLNAYLIAMAWFSLAILLWHGTPLVLASHLMALACSFFSFTMVIKLQAQWIVGFVDAEGCFTVYVRIAADGQTPLYLRPAFLVTQHNRNTQLLYALKAHFGCGQVYNQGKNAAEWKVRKLEHLLTKVIPFFEKHALKTQKNIEFRRFRDICLLMRDKVHRNPEGLQKCVVLARNLRVKRETQAEVPVILDDQPETV